MNANTYDLYVPKMQTRPTTAGQVSILFYNHRRGNTRAVLSSLAESKNDPFLKKKENVQIQKLWNIQGGKNQIKQNMFGVWWKEDHFLMSSFFNKKKKKCGVPHVQHKGKKDLVNIFQTGRRSGKCSKFSSKMEEFSCKISGISTDPTQRPTQQIDVY